MNCRSDNNLIRKGFSLIETLAALGVLAVITSSVLVIVDQCMNSTADMKLRRNAFEVARENMEILLTERTASEMSQFGISEQYPAIEWQKTIEMFAPQGSSDKWLRAVSIAQYYDSKDEIQSMEFTAWLTRLTKRDVLAIEKQRKILLKLEGIDGVGQPGYWDSDRGLPDGVDQPGETGPDGQPSEDTPKLKPKPDWMDSPLFKGLPEDMKKMILDGYYNS